MLSWFKDVCEYLEGARDVPPAGFPVPFHSLVWGVWWALLLLTILLFSGQTSKFIYIDF